MDKGKFKRIQYNPYSEAKMNFKSKKMIALYVILALVVLIAFSGGDDSEDANPQQAPEDRDTTTEPTTIQASIKESLDAWSQSLPTEYRLEELDNVCSRLHTTNCENTSIPSDQIAEGYSRVFAKDSDPGKAMVVLFDDAATAQLAFNSVVDPVKEERGYKEINTPSNCFGWEKEIAIITTQQIVCHHKNALTSMGIQGTFIFGDGDVKKFSEQLNVLVD